MRTTIRSTRRYCRTATMRSSAPSSRAMTMIPEAPPAIIEKAPVTGVIPRCSRSSRPAARLRARVVSVTSRTGSQVVATVRRVSRSTRAPMVTPMTACPAVVARGGTATPPRPPRARTSPAVRPPKRAGEGRPSAVNTRVTANAPATTRARSASCRRRREPTRSLCPEEPTHDRPGRADDGDGTCKGSVVTDLRHHGDAELAPGLVDLAVNVRAGTPPPWLRTLLHEALDRSAAYPDAGPARAAVAAAHGRDPSEVLLTAGAAEAFTLLARALRPHHAVVVHPSFTEPEAALRAAGHPVSRLLLPATDGYRLDPAAVPEDADLVVLGNPTNPTSVLHPAADVAALARPGRVLLVDEAFADTVPGEPESLAGRGDLPGLLVVRSLTQTWGLAGLRVGSALGPAPLIAAMADQQPHWPVSVPALAA